MDPKLQPKKKDTENKPYEVYNPNPKGRAQLKEENESRPKGKKV